MDNANWKRTRFGDLIEERVSSEIKKGEEHSFIPMENIESGLKFPRLVESKTFTGSGTKFADGDTLFARITPCLQNKKIVKVKNLKDGVGFGSTEYFVFRAKKGISDSDFIYYLSMLDDIRKTAELSMVGASGRQRASLKVIQDFFVNAPDFSTQSRIASVLSTYDDLIENNDKRIKILEEMAQRLYTEWFVKFKFPGHDKVRLVDSKTDFGKIPEWWEVKKLKDVADTISGYAFKSADFQKTGIPVIKIKNIESDGTVRIQDVDRISENILTNKMSKYVLGSGDIIVAMTGATAGKVGRIFNKEKMFLNQRVAKVEPRKDHYSLVWGRIGTEDAMNELYSLAGGAAQPNMSAAQIESISILVPSEGVLLGYEKLVLPMLNKILLLQRWNQNLSQIRDLLIPQLVTGKRELK